MNFFFFFVRKFLNSFNILDSKTLQRLHILNLTQLSHGLECNGVSQYVTVWVSLLFHFYSIRCLTPVLSRKLIGKGCDATGVTCWCMIMYYIRDAVYPVPANQI